MAEPTTLERAPHSPEPTWTRHDRLPLNAEISRNHGWPTAEVEAALEPVFFDNFRNQLADVLPPGEDLNKNQQDFLLATLYGFYFFNYVVGGYILRDHNANKLKDWPLKFDDTMNIMGIGNNDEAFHINLEKIKDLSRDWSLTDYISFMAGLIPAKPGTSLENQNQIAAKSPDLPIIYEKTFEEYSVTGGIEEGHHRLELMLRHHPNPKIAQALTDIFNQSEIDRYYYNQQMNQQMVHIVIQSHIKYHSNIELEYRAIGSQAIFARRYRKDLWENRGYKKFVDQIKQGYKEFVS